MADLLKQFLAHTTLQADPELIKRWEWDMRYYLQTLLDCKGHLAKAFTAYWQSRGVLNQAYKNNVQEVPHVCVKVPTAGGKTYIAVNALERVFTAFAEYNPSRPKFVVWLVPSL